jgi:methyl-accepting chemotaxis protein
VDTFRSIVEVVALLSASALCIYLIVVLVRLKEVLTLIQKDLTEIGAKAKPVLENLQVITESLKSVSAKIDGQIGLVRGSLESVKSAADNIVAFEQRIQESLEEPVLRLSTMIAAFVNRIASYFGGARA